MTPDLVSSTIVARSREPQGLRAMMVASSVAHVVAIAALVIVPMIVGPRSRLDENVMTISLGPPPGPPSTGLTGLADRPVQQSAPKPELPKPEPARPPAPKPKEMVETIAKSTAKPVKQPAQTTRPAPPTTGEQQRPGQGRVDTGTRSNETGLSTGGAGTGGDPTLSNFCDPAYLGQMVMLIHRNWQQGQAVTGKPIIRFVIQRDGTLTDVTIKQPSGYFVLDNNAQRAVMLTRAVPPLPSCYPYPDFAVNLTFEYIR